MSRDNIKFRDADHARWVAHLATARAKKLLLHYLAYKSHDGECLAEIASIVDDIVDAAVASAAVPFLDVKLPIGIAPRSRERERSPVSHAATEEGSEGDEP